MLKLADFIKFINEHCHTLRMINQNKPARIKQSVMPEKKGTKKVVLTSASPQCKICQGAHQTFRCEDLIKLSPDDRKKCIVEKRLCINCLNIGHQAKECKASACKKCSGRHNTILHREETKKAERDENAVATVVTHCTGFFKGNEHISHKQGQLTCPPLHSTDLRSRCQWTANKLSRSIGSWIAIQSNDVRSIAEIENILDEEKHANQWHRSNANRHKQGDTGQG